MRFAIFALLAAVACVMSPHVQAKEPPSENAYDVVGKALRPFIGTLLGGKNVTNNAVTMRVTISGVTGRLPAEMAGAVVDMAFEFPDKARVSAPVLGEMMIVCRNGDSVWGTPGAKMEFLLARFPDKPAVVPRKRHSPIYMPMNATEAGLLPALFSIEKASVAETVALDGEDCRVIAAGLMPLIADVLKWEGFRVRMWVASGYVPRRVEIRQPDFTVTAEITDLKFVPSLPASTWSEPTATADNTDIYRAKSELLEAVLYVVFNSLNSNEK